MKVELIAIRNAADYEAARALVASLMNAQTERDGARLRAQATLVAAYEAEQVRNSIPADVLIG